MNYEKLHNESHDQESQVNNTYVRIKEKVEKKSESGEEEGKRNQVGSVYVGFGLNWIWFGLIG